MHCAPTVSLIAFAVWSYNVNFDAQAAEGRVASLAQEIEAEKEKIAVLKAEWAYLNRPERLRRLSEAHFETLRLVAVRLDHFGDPGDLPDAGTGTITGVLTTAAQE